jgi:hypothetical protein
MAMPERAVMSERRIMAEHFSAVKDEADFMLAMLRAFDSASQLVHRFRQPR